MNYKVFIPPSGGVVKKQHRQMQSCETLKKKNIQRADKLRNLMVVGLPRMTEDPFTRHKGPLRYKNYVVICDGIHSPYIILHFTLIFTLPNTAFYSRSASQCLLVTLYIMVLVVSVKALIMCLLTLIFVIKTI